VNGAHPYEDPTPLTNFVEMLAIASAAQRLNFRPTGTEQIA
jgi:K+-transporting ATPase A subunit